MSCSRYQYELSQCLDGRLPSGRRSAVLAHASDCPRCSQVWEDLQAAQSLIFRLDENPVAPGFRDSVWDRIHAGEGAPDILLNEPVSTATKLRYAAFGAAAAALLLVAINFTIGTGTGPSIEDRVAELDRSIDDETSSDHLPPGPTTPIPIRDNSPAPPPSSQVLGGNPGFMTKPLTAATLANHAIGEVAGAATRLRRKRDAVLSNPQDTPAGVWTDIRNDVQLLGDGLQFLGALEREDFVEFLGHSRFCMEQARVALVTKSHDKQSIQGLVRSLTACPLDGLEDGLRFRARATNFDTRLVRLIQQDQERMTRMFLNMRVMLPTMPSLQAQQAQQPQFYIFIRQDISGMQHLHSGPSIQLHNAPGQTSPRPGKLKARRHDKSLRKRRGN